MKRRGTQFLDRYIRLVLESVSRALVSAGFRSDEDVAHAGLICAGHMPAADTIRHFIETYDVDGASAVSPMEFPNCAFSAASAQVGIRLGLGGVNGTVIAGAASGLAGIEVAIAQIESGAAAVLVNAVQEVNSITSAHHVCDEPRAHRNGSGGNDCSRATEHSGSELLGEAVCTLVLESVEHASARGAHVWARLAAPVIGFLPEASYALEGDANADPASLAAIFRRAIDEAKLDTQQLDFVYMSASGWPWLEVRALHTVIAARTAILSGRRAFGDLVGAEPLVHVALSALSFDRQVLPPALRYDRSKPDHERGCGRATAEPRVLRNALVTTLCRSGVAGAVTLSRGEPGA
jgi:3-oxoacyl-[acyl-carrier-protein] synthase II